jgi:hypothetical protein
MIDAGILKGMAVAAEATAEKAKVSTHQDWTDSTRPAYRDKN